MVNGCVRFYTICSTVNGEKQKCWKSLGWMGGEGQTGERVGRKGGKHGKGRQREGGLLRVASSERRAWEGGGGGGQDALDQYWSVATQSDKSDRQLDK